MAYETYENENGKATTVIVTVEIDGDDGKSLVIERGVVSIIDSEGGGLSYGSPGSSTDTPEYDDGSVEISAVTSVAGEVTVGKYSNKNTLPLNGFGDEVAELYLDYARTIAPEEFGIEVDDDTSNAISNFLDKAYENGTSITVEVISGHIMYDDYFVPTHKPEKPNDYGLITRLDPQKISIDKESLKSLERLDFLKTGMQLEGIEVKKEVDISKLLDSKADSMKEEKVSVSSPKISKNKFK